MRRFPAFGARRGLGYDTSAAGTALESLIPFAGAINVGQQAENTYYALQPSVAGNSVWDDVVNAATGHETQAQSNTLVNQEVQELVQAGMDPAEAQAQAEADVNWSLQQAGAAPISVLDTTGSILGSSLPTWAWLLIAGAAFLLIKQM